MFDDAKKQSKLERNTFIMRLLFVPFTIVPLGMSYYFAKLPAQPEHRFQWFHLHPLLMLLGFITAAGNAVTLKKIGGLANTRLHIYLMSVTWVFALLGGYVIYTDKEMANKLHLTSLHGQIGAAVLTGLFLYQTPTGFYFLHPDTGILKT